MEPVVVCYFPGAGGVRLVNHLAGLNYRAGPATSFHQILHTRIQDREQARLIHMPPHTGIVYAEWDTEISVPQQYPITGTHCMSTPIIQHHYPGRKIIKIKSDLIASLARVWQLESQHHQQSAIQQQGLEKTVLDNINFHLGYYTRTGVDWSADQLIDISQDLDEFSVFMREIFSVTQSSDFLGIIKQHPDLWQALINTSI
jgi:hypothetical protein